MPCISAFSPTCAGSDRAPEEAAREREAVEAITALLEPYAPEVRDRILSKLTQILRPIPAPRAGEVLGALVRLLPQQRSWTVEALKESVEASGVEAPSKELYNALGYLTRKGRIRRVGYGRYSIDGAQIVTSDDLGGATLSQEDEYRTDRN